MCTYESGHGDRPAASFQIRKDLVHAEHLVFKSRLAEHDFHIAEHGCEVAPFIYIDRARPDPVFIGLPDQFQ